MVKSHTHRFTPSGTVSSHRHKLYLANGSMTYDQNTGALNNSSQTLISSASATAAGRNPAYLDGWMDGKYSAYFCRNARHDIIK